MNTSINSPLLGMDGLRALACLAVFGVHWQQLTGFAGRLGPIDYRRLLENGNTGVALFMILSGLLLSRPWFTGHFEVSKQPSVISYFRNRAGRILPAYCVCLGTLVVLRRNWHSASELRDVAVHLVFLHNFWSVTLYSINPPFWALAVIVQFYVYFGILIVCLRWIGCMKGWAILSVSILIALVSQLLVGLLSSIEPSSGSTRDWIGSDAVCLEHSLLSHLSLFSLGIVAAAIEARLMTTRSRWFDVLVVVFAGVLLLILATPLDELLQVPGGRYNFPFVPIVLAVIALASSRAIWITRFLEAFPVRRLGVISYGFYLFHLPVMKMILKAAQSQGIKLAEHPFLFALASFAVTVLVSELSFRWLERPLGHWLRGRSPAV